MDHNSNPTRKDNGKVEEPPQLIITVTDPIAFSLNISGAFPTLDYALNMLDQARRELDSQWRAAKLVQVQRQLADQAQANAIAQSLRRTV